MFDELTISEAAGLMASVASDADRSYGEMRASRRMIDILANFEDIVVSVSNVEWKNGVEPAEEINYSAAAAAERWTAGMEWDELVDRTRAEEGDLVRLLSRTGEALRQLGKSTTIQTRPPPQSHKPRQKQCSRDPSVAHIGKTISYWLSRS